MTDLVPNRSLAARGHSTSALICKHWPTGDRVAVLFNSHVAHWFQVWTALLHPSCRNEFKRCGVHDFPPVGVPVVDSFRIFTQQEPRSLAAAVQFYCGRPQQQSTAHSALADAQNTLDVLIEQVRSYKDLPRRVSELANICGRPNRAQDVTHDGKFQWRGEIPVVAFGKYAGALACFKPRPLRVQVYQSVGGKLPCRSFSTLLHV